MRRSSDAEAAALMSFCLMPAMPPPTHISNCSINWHFSPAEAPIPQFPYCFKILVKFGQKFGPIHLKLFISQFYSNLIYCFITQIQKCLIVFPPEFGALYKNSLRDAPSFYCFTIQARMRLKENQKDVDFDLYSSSTFSLSLKLGPNYLE